MSAPLEATLQPSLLFRDHTSRVSGLHLHLVNGDRFEPVARRGDFVLVAPCVGWRGEGDYLVEVAGDPALYRCDAFGSREEPIRMGSPNPFYRQPWTMSRSAFDAAVIGVVVATLQVSQPDLLRELFRPT